MHQNRKVGSAGGGFHQALPEQGIYLLGKTASHVPGGPSAGRTGQDGCQSIWGSQCGAHGWGSWSTLDHGAQGRRKQEGGKALTPNTKQKHQDCIHLLQGTIDLCTGGDFILTFHTVTEQTLRA